MVGGGGLVQISLFSILDLKKNKVENPDTHDTHDTQIHYQACLYSKLCKVHKIDQVLTATHVYSRAVLPHSPVIQ